MNNWIESWQWYIDLTLQIAVYCKVFFINQQCLSNYYQNQTFCELRWGKSLIDIEQIWNKCIHSVDEWKWKKKTMNLIFDSKIVVCINQTFISKFLHRLYRMSLVNYFDNCFFCSLYFLDIVKIF